MKHIQVFTFAFLIYASNCYACYMGFTTYLDSLPTNTEYSELSSDSINKFLDKIYGNKKWVEEDSTFEMKIAERAENSAVVPVRVGSDNEDLAGKYSDLILYVVEYIEVINAHDFSHIKSKAFGYDEYAHKEGKISMVAGFKLSESMLPYISISLNLTHTRSAKVIAVFIPTAKTALIKVIIQNKEVITGHNCSTTYFIRGEFPAGLKN